jgi:hypothetical protein
MRFSVNPASFCFDTRDRSSPIPRSLRPAASLVESALASLRTAYSVPSTPAAVVSPPPLRALINKEPRTKNQEPGTLLRTQLYTFYHALQSTVFPAEVELIFGHPAFFILPPSSLILFIPPRAGCRSTEFLPFLPYPMCAPFAEKKRPNGIPPIAIAIDTLSQHSQVGISRVCLRLGQEPKKNDPPCFDPRLPPIAKHPGLILHCQPAKFRL